MKRMMILALLTVVSMGLKAQDAQVKVVFSDFTGGTVVTKAIEGQEVTITVTPDEGYFIAKSDIEVVAVKDPASATRGDETISIGSALELIGDDPDDLTETREYSFIVPEGLGAWVCTADFHEAGKPVTSGDLNDDVTWEVTGDEGAMVLTLSGKGTADIVLKKGGSEDLPWSQFSADITELVIEGDIEAIGDGLLKDLTALTAITLKSSKFVSLGNNELPEDVAVDVPGQFYNEYKANKEWSEAATVASATGVLMKGVAFGKGNDYDVFVSAEPVLVPSVLLAFTVSAIDGSNVKISSIDDGIIPADVPVLLLSKEIDDDEFMTAASEKAGSAKDEGLLQAAGEGGKEVALGEVYLLYNDVFYLSQAGTIPAGGIYLTIPKEESGKEQLSKTRSALTIGTDGTTAIDPARLYDLNAPLSGAWYDLSGRRLPAKPTTKGVYIINGNKVIIR